MTRPLRPRRRPLARLAGAVSAFALAAGILSAGPAALAVADAADPGELAGLDYVALGDSYSAGYGIDPYSFTTPADGCFQAEENYPHQVAAGLGLNLTDVTCSGAVTANIRDTKQTTLTGQGVAAVQSLALSADTDLVTVTIGGNDLGFADVAAFCVALSPTGPVMGNPFFDTCAAYYRPIPEDDRLQQKLDTVVAPALVKTFDLIRTKAPNAEVVVVGYPTITPDIANVPAGGCFSPALTGAGPPYPENAFPYTAEDTLYLHSVEAKLDAAIQSASDGAGFHYVSTLPLTEANSACQTDGTAYVNGVTLLQATPEHPHPGGTPTPDPDLFVKYGALHPNVAGVAFLAEQVTAAVHDVLAVDPGEEPPTASPTPTPAPGAAPAAQTPGGATPALAATGLTALPLAALAVTAVAAATALLLVRRRARRTPGT